jgi:hypothetical protein
VNSLVKTAPGLGTTDNNLEVWVRCAMFHDDGEVDGSVDDVDDDG